MGHTHDASAEPQPTLDGLQFEQGDCDAGLRVPGKGGNSIRAAAGDKEAC
jgi:hypothetical protein